MRLRQTNSVPAAAAKAGFSTATGYRIALDPVLPSQRGTARERRRPDPLADIFDSEIVPLQRRRLGLRAVAVFEDSRGIDAVDHCVDPETAGRRFPLPG